MMTRLACFILTIAVAVLSTSPYSARAQESGKEGKTVIRFVSWKPNQPKVWDDALERFSKAYPHIEVVRDIGPHSSTEYHDLLTQKLKNRDTTVDVFFIDVIWPSEFAAAGWALPLDDRFPAAEQQNFLKATIEAGTYKGRIYGLPGWIDSGMLYYRKDLLEKFGFSPPKTWNELVSQARRIVKGEEKTHPGLRGYSGQFKQYEGLVCDMLEFIGSNQGSLMNDEGTQSLLATRPSLDAVRFARDEIIQKLATRVYPGKGRLSPELALCLGGRK
jgi:multiple sugar transport system substrate-binding protein